MYRKTAQGEPFSTGGGSSSQGLSALPQPCGQEALAINCQSWAAVGHSKAEVHNLSGMPRPRRALQLWKTLKLHKVKAERAPE